MYILYAYGVTQLILCYVIEYKYFIMKRVYIASRNKRSRSDMFFQSEVYDGSVLCCVFVMRWHNSVPCLNVLNYKLLRGFFYQELNLFVHRAEMFLSSENAKDLVYSFNKFDNDLPF